MGCCCAVGQADAKLTRLKEEVESSQLLMWGRMDLCNDEAAQRSL